MAVVLWRLPRRQALIGGGYELVNRTTFEPNPDYFAALLWRSIVGTTVLPAPALAAADTAHAPRLAADVRAYAACARGDADGAAAAWLPNASRGAVVVVALNLNPNASISLALN